MRVVDVGADCFTVLITAAECAVVARGLAAMSGHICGPTEPASERTRAQSLHAAFAAMHDLSTAIERSNKPIV